ncbi:hypothetical protein [Paraburkholderia kirstenboschensis]|uniref:Uncharacterized protein n=1 Tax=Paraburkholderia kirstenboschensis TaxID=1245436 RepID=A0ABZ0EHW2_9BURK|nr:hypothetical protein [Paraburkholderia kirstenboschensis]WOD15887.1 hypothetical protein RW095_21905 [Paraburkholderia kirstenboschensis]
MLTPEPARVETIKADDNGFRIDYRPLPGIEEGAVRSVHASRVLLAAGIRDGLPSIPNAAELTRRDLFDGAAVHPVIGCNARTEPIQVWRNSPMN